MTPGAERGTCSGGTGAATKFVCCAVPHLNEAQGGHAAVIEALHFEGGAALDAAGADGRQPLHWAAMMQRLDAARTLLRLGAPVAAVDGAAWQAHHMAAVAGHTQALRLLLASVAQVDAATQAGSTALWLASSSGGVDALRLLLANGAKAAAVQHETQSQPIHKAADKGHAAVIEALHCEGTLRRPPDTWMRCEPCCAWARL